MHFLLSFLSPVGRVLLVAIFLLSAIMNKLLNFGGTVAYMAKEGVPVPSIALIGAIVFLIVGAISVAIGFKARIGALLLLVFLILATYYFHDFWTFEGEAVQPQMIHFMKNLSIMGALLTIIANGPGAWSVDNYIIKKYGR